MVASSQIIPGMIVSIGQQLFRVESSVKVAVTKGSPFIKTKLRNLNTSKLTEKNFKPDQNIKEVALERRTLEFLYADSDSFLFLDIDNLEHVTVPGDIVAGAVDFLKEGVQLSASFYGDTVFAVELPQFLELMVASTSADGAAKVAVANTIRQAVLETGARMNVPPFIEAGDIIKVDTKTSEYIQRV
ncbi:Elongation factor P 1 [Chlamydiales bacterium SCGC AG-110-P3]|nr:Elongation factor P 1 [Chlamydiales bacterium SCGC AG-110-P3]